MNIPGDILADSLKEYNEIKKTLIIFEKLKKRLRKHTFISEDILNLNIQSLDTAKLWVENEFVKEQAKILRGRKRAF